MSLFTQIGATDWVRGFKPCSCAEASCGRWLTERQLRVRPMGVSLNDSWYCSYRCAFLSVEAVVRKLATPARRLFQAETRMSLGLSLLQRGLLSEAQYKAAMTVKRDTGQEMGDAVIKLGFLSEGAIAEARAALWSCPAMNWDGGLSAVSVHLPQVLLQHYRMLPVHLLSSTNRLFLGFRHNVEYVPLFAVEQITGYKVQPCILPASNYEALAEVQGNDGRHEDRIICDVTTAGEMARLLCQVGREVDAVTIAVARCGHYVWGRLNGGFKVVDLLFPVT